MEDICLMEFKPDARAISSPSDRNVPGSDYWRLLTTLDILRYLESKNMPTHLRHERALESRDSAGNSRWSLVVARCQPIPIRWMCRYEAAGSLVRLFPSLVKAGQPFARPLFHYDYKQPGKNTNDVVLNESYIVGLNLLNPAQLTVGQYLLATIGEYVADYLQRAGMRLIDMQVEFGFLREGQMVLIDEISQDCMRVVDDTTGEPLTRDAFQKLQTPEQRVKAYETFARRLNPAIEGLRSPPT
jgi:phosphoribosylaminoimidazole-succinocarboxamide synthase